MIICLTEVVGVVEQEYAQVTGISLVDSRDDEVARHRAYLASIYDSLPGYGSKAFWRVVEEPDLRSTLPLEVLVKCVRAAIAYGDNEGRNRIVTVIIRRTQASWEGRTEKDTARILGVTDRTVRNRLHEALKLLREKPGMERGAWL